MHLALEQLSKKPEYIIVDGNRFKSFQEIPHQCIVKGDGKYQNIAAASVLAKTYRDDFMEKLGLEFPQYDWKKIKATLQKNIARQSRNMESPPIIEHPFNCYLNPKKYSFLVLIYLTLFSTPIQHL